MEEMTIAKNGQGIPVHKTKQGHTILTHLQICIKLYMAPKIRQSRKHLRGHRTVVLETIQALEALGFSGGEAKRMVNSVEGVCLPQSGRSKKKHMVKRFPPLFRRLDINFQIFLLGGCA